MEKTPMSRPPPKLVNQTEFIILPGPERRISQMGCLKMDC